jgi:hypothetical protein
MHPITNRRSTSLPSDIIMGKPSLPCKCKHNTCQQAAAKEKKKKLRKHIRDLLSETVKTARKACVAQLCDKAEKARGESENDKVPYGFIEKLVKDMRDEAPWLTRDHINNELRRHNARKKQSSTISSSSPSLLSSSLSSDSCMADDYNSNKMSETSLTSTTNENELAELKESLRAAGGHPQGSTKEQKCLKKLAIKVLKNEVAILFAKEKQDTAAKGSTLPKGRLKAIIDDRKAHYNLPDFHIPLSTIWAHMNHNNLIVEQCGLISPMTKVEPILVEVLIQCGNMRQPLSVSNGLHLANSLIDGTPLKADIIAW